MKNEDKRNERNKQKVENNSKEKNDHRISLNKNYNRVSSYKQRIKNLIIIYQLLNLINQIIYQNRTKL